MWIGLMDASSGAAITDGSFSAGFYNYSSSDPGWYYVLVGADTWLYANAPGYNQGSAYTNSYDSFVLYLVHQSTGGGGGGKK